MAKFCGKCGSPLNEQGLCPNCAPAPAAPPAETVPEQSYQPVVPAENTPAPKKKKLPLVPVIIAAAVVVVGALVACAFIFHWFGLGKSEDKKNAKDSYVSSQRNIIVKTSYGTFDACTGLNLSNQDGWDYLNNREEAQKMTLAFTDESGKLDSADLMQMAQDGDDFYGIDGDNYTTLYHCKVLNYQTGEKKVWFSEEQLKNSCIKLTEASWRLNYFIADGDYVYANIYPDSEHITLQKDMNERIVKLGRDGKTIEFVGDESVRALEYVVRDGWIYYVDNGFVYDGGISYDKDRIGLYKIKTDGSEKTRLWGDFTGNADNALGNACNLALYKDYLYFLDVSEDSGSSPLCRIKLDGSDFTTLSSKSVLTYTFDTDKDQIYYQTGRYAETKMNNFESIIRVDLNSKTEETILTDKAEGVNDYLAYDNGSLYGSSNWGMPTGFKSSPPFAMLGKLDVDDKTTYLLLRDYESKTRIEGSDYKVEQIKNEVNWKEYEYFW